ncbi:uncharacterized protein LTR77_003988 [Saxophila tyrrhenica]|uniref:Vezatin n=1 Tax=Saxophila tyrrhenica TaxID=1690608 RepID=A0AAV9PIQ2_9PEZI|nr:hypothetical protein LTR77_003988 [Saxophila tyrrhenica]
METFHDDGTPLATYLEGEGYLDTRLDTSVQNDHTSEEAGRYNDETPTSFAPRSNTRPTLRTHKSIATTLRDLSKPKNALGRIHNAWSTALNSRLGRADNARFLEHFRYIIVASQLLNEYLDQGALPPSLPNHGLDGTAEGSAMPSVATSLYGATGTAIVAFALVYLIHWARSSRDGALSTSRIALVLAIFLVTAFVGYGYVRRQWLKFLRRQAVAEITTLTANWQAFEVSASSALSLIQEVELVSKGYRLSTPLPPASRIDDQSAARRCIRLRKLVYHAYSSVIPTCISTCETLRALIDADDLEKYFEIYDINPQDAKEAAGSEALSVLDDDAESLKSLRVLSYRAGVLRRVMLSSLMSLEADGGKPDFLRWRVASDAMGKEASVIGQYAEKLQQCLSEMETLATPLTPANRSPTFPARDKMRTQVRKISMLSSGIRSLQAKMQILREETNRSIEQSEDLSDLGPNLMAQYESIGADLKELMHAWETGKASLQSNLTKQDRRISRASSVRSSIRSPISSISGLTAVEEGGGPMDALKALTGDSMSNRSSMATTPDEEIFEAVAMPRQRSTLSREERILKMQEERDRQATARAQRESNTGMLRELQTVLSQRPPKATKDGMRITSI